MILRKAIDAHFDAEPVLVLELGLGGAKFEHSERMDIGREGNLACADLMAIGVVCYSILLPARHGVVYQTGVSFTALDPEQTEALFKLLIEEAQDQVKEWEANLRGLAWKPSVAPRSAVASRFVALHLTPEGWRQEITSDPNQPPDGVTVMEDTVPDELAVLSRTYQRGDESERELLRRMATLAILERLHA